MKKLALLICLLTFLSGFACTAYVQPPPPALRADVKPTKPNKNAVWVPGHWEWRNKRVGYLWVPGHWKINK